MQPSLRRSAYSMERSAPPFTSSVTMTIAFKILTKWPKQSPAPEALMSEFGMSKATAYRWRRALIDARGI